MASLVSAIETLKPCKTLTNPSISIARERKKMGKIPSSFLSTVSTQILKKTPETPVLTNSVSQKPNHVLKRSAKRLTPKLSIKRLPTQLDNSSEIQDTSCYFSSSSLPEAKKRFDSIILSQKSALDLRFYNNLLQSYSSISTINDSISFLRYMSKTHPLFSPDRSTYHILLNMSCSVSHPALDAARQILNLMVNDGFHPDKVTTDIAVRSLCLSGRLDDAVDLVKELSLKHSSPDTYTYNFVVKHLCKSKSLSTVNRFIDEMRETHGVKPDLVTYTILIDNVCNSKNLREATRLVRVLAEEGFKPDCYVYNTIMKGYCMLGRGTEAIGVYNKMKEEGVEPDVVTFNTLIFGLSKSGQVKAARKFLDIMAEMGHFPDAVTYTSLMNGMCRQNNALGALALLGEMEAKGCSPNSCTYNTLLHGLCKGRHLEKGVELYEGMRSSGMKLETTSYATFVRVLCRNGKIAEAYEVFDYAIESKSLTDVAAYLTLEGTLKWVTKAREQGHAT